MATLLVYTLSPFVPFTVIRSADVNQYFTDIKTRFNWAGGSSTTTGLGDDNIQSNTVSGGGLTRATKLKLGTAYAAVINSSTGAVSEVVIGATKVVTSDANGALQGSATLSPALGGTGAVIVPTNIGDTVQVLPGLVLGLGAPPTPAANRVFNFYQFN